MSFAIQTITSEEAVIKYLVDTLSNKLLASMRVLWLVTGGSAIAIAAATSKRLTGLSFQNLTVTLTDERYGAVGHPDSNWWQLQNSGFSLPNANLIPLLIEKDINETTRQFARQLEESFKKVDYTIGFFGIGPDGHTAGILPGSPAVDSADLAVSYSDDEVTIDSPEGVKRGVSRITISPLTISKLDEAVVYAIGEHKWPTIKQLNDNLSIETQPAQALKQVSKLTIFTDMEEVI